MIRKAKHGNAVSVGIRQKKADFVAENVKLDAFSSRFTVKKKGENLGEFMVNVPGIHNVYNALLAIATSRMNGIDVPVIRETLAHFKNADRRFQLKVRTDNLMVIDDYAHHPSEITATLAAAKNLSRETQSYLIAVFQPHLYSRTQLLYKEFAKSLSRADLVVLTDIYAAREKNENNISVKMIFDEVVKIKGIANVIYSKELKGVPEMVKPHLNGKNIVVTLGAGDVWKVSEMFSVPF